MANICKNAISLINLQEPLETFIRALSMSMFAVDVDDLDAKMWGAVGDDAGKLSYTSLVDQFRREGFVACRYGILYPFEPTTILGISLPRAYCETKWKPPIDELSHASASFPEVTFHMSWLVLQDGPSGEVIARNGRILEVVERQASWYLFDSPVHCPIASLLPAHVDLTLAQRGALRVQDAIETIEGLRSILDDRRFVDSPFHQYRDSRKLSVTRRTLDDLLAQMRQAAERLSFDGVFLEETEAAEKAAVMDARQEDVR